MPQAKSAVKRMRQSKKREASSRSAKSTLKTLSRKYYDLIEQKNAKEAQALLKELYRNYDKVAKRGIIKVSTANRKKSRFTSLLNTITK